MRDDMIRAGYSVSERSCHIGRAWDWSRPTKGPMDSRHYTSPELAEAAAEEAFEREVLRAKEVLAVVEPQVVWVVMGNDYPSGVFSSEALAEADIARRKVTDIAHYTRPAIYWRTYAFTLDDA